MQSPDQTPPGRVLVVADSPIFHEKLRVILGYGIANYEIDSAHRGRQALDLVQHAVKHDNPYRVVFVEGRVPPGWDALQTMNRLWRADPHLQMVLCTGRSDYGWDEIVDRIGESDQMLLLKKPLGNAEVQQAACALMAKWRLARANEVERNTADVSELEQTSEQLCQEKAERERVEEELRKSQRLHALGRLAAGLGHEINNPLTFVLSGAESALEELNHLHGEVPEKSLQTIEELLGIIRTGGDRIAQLVRNVKLVSHSDETTCEQVDVAAAIQLALDMVRPKAADHIEIITDIAKVPGVWCKRIELEQVVANLLQNAIHAMADSTEGPSQLCVVSRLDRDGFAAIEIADNGKGIPKNHLDKVFEPFFTTKPPGEGTGLGLAICHAIIAGLGGTIEVTSEVGQGTTVAVRLPCIPHQLKPATATANTTPVPLPGVPAERSEGRVLVVDDEPLIRRVVSFALAQHDVVQACNGREALDHCRSSSFDVILCDIGMPEIDGLEFYNRLKEMCPGAEEDIIFFTGGVQSEDVHAFLERVPNDCLEKPVERRRLQQHVIDKVRSNRHRARA